MKWFKVVQDVNTWLMVCFLDEHIESVYAAFQPINRVTYVCFISDNVTSSKRCSHLINYEHIESRGENCTVARFVIDIRIFFEIFY